MMSITLILGGARSGKSSYAEASSKQQLKQDLKIDGAHQLHYVATALPFDDEMKQRILHHQQRRGDEWVEHEAPTQLAELIESFTETDIVLVDCLTVWLNNVIYNDGDCLGSDQIQNNVDRLIVILNETDASIYIVSNEVGLGVVPMGQVSRLFVDHAGWMNQRIASIAQRVVLVTAGLPLMLKSDVCPQLTSI
jgi:adenosylcobinamide kinase/adenosylcobinamide-phosphate guanylyltransferase